MRVVKLTERMSVLSGQGTHTHTLTHTQTLFQTSFPFRSFHSMQGYDCVDWKTSGCLDPRQLSGKSTRHIEVYVSSDIDQKRLTE